MRLENKIALISGAGSGIGEASAKTFAREGAQVVIADINTDAGYRVVHEIREAGGTAVFVAVNILDPTQIEAMIEFAVKTFGRLDVLMNNAQVSAGGGQRLGDISLADWQRALDGGLTSYWYASKLAVGHMLRLGGRRHRQHRVGVGVGRRLWSRPVQCFEGGRREYHTRIRDGVRTERHPL